MLQYQLFLAANEESPAVKVLDYFYDKKVKLIYSDEIIEEYIDVLNRKKFDFDKSIIKEFIELIRNNGIKLNPNNIREYDFDIKDKPFYELVLDKSINNKKLVTGNTKHFPSDANIITPKELVNLIEHLQNELIKGIYK